MAGGSRRSTGRLDSLVKQANLNRDKREQVRIQEEERRLKEEERLFNEEQELQAAKKIQKFTRKQFEMMKRAEVIEKQWLENDFATSSNGKEVLVGFSYFFVRRYRGSQQNKEELQRVAHIVRENRDSIEKYVCSMLIMSISIMFKRHSEASSSQECQILGLQIFNTLDPSSLPVSLLSVFQSYLTLGPSLNSELSNELSTTCNTLATQYPREYFNVLLLTPNLHSFINTDLPDFTRYQVIKTAEESTVKFGSIIDQLWQLANFVNLISNRAMDKLTLIALDHILSNLNISLVSKKSSGFDRKSTLTPGNATIYETDDESLLESIEKLYSREFVNGILAILLPEIESSFGLLASVFVSLERLSPKKKQDLTLFISLNTARPLNQTNHTFPFSLQLWRVFEKTDLYKKYGSGILKGNDILGIVVDYQELMSQLLLVLELCSYWLIVTDDSEFHTHVASGGQALQEMVNMASFLKNWTFSMIMNWPKTSQLELLSETSIGTLNMVKSIEIMVLRQIYMRDSRRQFLQNGFWLMTDYFNMQDFIVKVVQDEKRRVELEELAEEASDSSSSDEDEDEGQVRARKARRMAHLESTSPRLDILRQTPFFIPFQLRVRIFQAFVNLDKQRTSANSPNEFNLFGVQIRHQANIRRDHLLQDAYTGFNGLNKEFKGKIAVTFFNEYGSEMGIDGGGVTKEFLTSVCREAFQPTPDNEYHYEDSKKGLFSVSQDELLYPNPILGVSQKYTALSATERKEALQYIQFLGKMIGKCLYEGILIDVEFSLFFLQKLTGMVRNSFDDMYSLDPDVYNSLIQLYNYDGNVEDLALDFTVSQRVGHGKTATIPLVPDGAQRPVTAGNRLEYIYAVSNYKLNTVLSAQTVAFLKGLSELISLDWLSMFNGPELQMLISGAGSARIDINDLKAHTHLYDFKPDSPTVLALWDVLENDFDEDQRRLFVKFVTSVPKAPLLGFGALTPQFAIRRSGNEQDRLPTSSTCVNLLKLPEYWSKEVLKKKLLDSINADAGFDLS